MKQIFITEDFHKEGPPLDLNHKPIVIDPLKDIKNIETFQKATNHPIVIYDITHSNKLNPGEIIRVYDHINQTGHNPLIGNQNKLQNPFIDISNLYNSKDGVITHCLGKYFHQHKKTYDFPSKYLCYISIIAKAVGHNNISAFLGNKT